MKQEISAGGIIIRKVNLTYEVLLLKDMNNSWTFPKGIVEENESFIEAAIREIKEEVGLSNLSFLTDLNTINYTYRKNGLINKTVHYFLFLYEGQENISIQREEGLKDAKWFSFPKALEIVNYKDTNTILLEKVINNLN